MTILSKILNILTLQLICARPGASVQEMDVSSALKTPLVGTEILYARRAQTDWFLQSDQHQRMTAPMVVIKY